MPIHATLNGGDTIDPVHLGTGTANGTKYLRDDGAWITPPGGGGGAWGGITGTLGDQTDLAAALDAKASASHSHAQSNITGLVSDLSAIASAITACALDTDLSAHEADATNVHGIANTANLILEGDSRLSDARNPLTHTHPLSALTQSGATSNQVPQWTGSAWTPVTIAGAGPASYSIGSTTVATDQYIIAARRVRLTGTQRVTLQGTASLRII